jgi:hypothetical protein
LTMFGHLPVESLMDLVEGTAAPSARAHAASCELCRGRVAEVAEAWTMAFDPGVPEPSPLYWESFRRQVGRRIEGEGSGGWRPRWLLPLVAAAGLLVALPVMRMSRSAPSPAPESVGALPAWSALPPADEDDGLEVLRAVATADSDLAAGFERRGVQEMLLDLSDEESQALAETLRAKVGKGGAL